MLLILYFDIKNQGDISKDNLKKILNLKNIHIKPVLEENILVVKKNYDKQERILSDLIDEECLQKELNNCQLYDSNDDILTLAYKLALLRNKEYSEIFKITAQSDKSKHKKSIFNLLNDLIHFLILTLIIIFIIIIIIYVIKRIYICIHKKI